MGPFASRSTNLRTVPRFDPSEEVVGITDPLGYFDPLGFAKVGDLEGPLGAKSWETGRGTVDTRVTYYIYIHN